MNQQLNRIAIKLNKAAAKLEKRANVLDAAALVARLNSLKDQIEPKTNFALGVIQGFELAIQEIYNMQSKQEVPDGIKL